MKAISEKSALVTGGAGFIGSHLAGALAMMGWEVTILDSRRSSPQAKHNTVSKQDAGPIKYIVGDCKNATDIKKAVRDVDVVFHFAANPQVRLELNDTQTCFRENVLSTHVLLEEFSSSQARTIVFPSTSAIYGQARTIPTPEDYGPLEPISVYGGSKLASEALITAYAHMCEKNAIILRLANIVGPESTHGIIPDLVNKLRKNPRELHIYGDGSQSKSYLYIEDCINAIIFCCSVSDEPVEIFNVGSEDQVSVARIAEIIVQEAGLINVKLIYKGGMEHGKGWVGDITNMLLDIGKLKLKGWHPAYGSEESVRLTAKALLRSIGTPIAT